MSPRFMSATPLLALVVLVAAPARPSAAQDAAAEAPKPDFTGVYLFNPDRSDDVRQLVEKSVGSGYTRGDIKKDLVRVWIRRWLLGVIEDPEARYLTIEQSRREFKSGLGDNVSIYYFGREASSSGPGREPLKVTVSWQDAQLVTEERSEDGGRLTALYTLLPGDETLIVAIRLEHKSLDEPLQVRMMFDRVPDEE